jgi:hypothetical protein
MTRITNFGRKRTHVEATFNYNEAGSEDSDADRSQGGAAGEPTVVAVDVEGAEPTEVPEDCRGVDGQPPKKKRKRGPRKKAGAKTATTAEGGDGGEEVVVDGAEGKAPEDKFKHAPGKKAQKSKSKLRSLQGSSPSHLPHTQTHSPPQNEKKLQKSDNKGESPNETLTPPVSPVEKGGTPCKIVRKSLMGPSNRQRTKAGSARQAWWGSATVVVLGNTGSRLAGRKFPILRIPFLSPPASSAMGTVTWPRSVPRTGRKVCTRTEGIANCAEKRITWREIAS